jgi:hypothetical protein
MKGKRLFQLINELTRTEHRQLVNACKLSADKRAAALGQLLRKRNLTENTFEQWRTELIKSWNIADVAEQDKKQRRWVDFCCKEIERLLLNNHVANSDLGYHELAKIFDSRNHEDLTAYYNQLAVQSAKAHNELSRLVDGYDIQLRWLSRNQTKKNIADMAALLLKRNQATELAYHRAMSYSYSVSSALYIDSPDDASYKQLIPTTEAFLALRNATTEEYSRILYMLAETRFSFYDRKEFERLLKSVRQAVEKCRLPDMEKALLERGCSYLHITAGLYYAYDTDKLIADAEAMLAIMLRYKMHDTTGFFFLLFLLLIKGSKELYDKLLKKHKAAFATEEGKDYWLFLQAMRLCLDNKCEQATDCLLQTSYSKSAYVAAWSRLLDISIHLKMGNKRYAQTLVERTKRFLKINSGHRVLYGPVSQALLMLERKLHDKPIPKEVPLFGYYNWFK